jgi:hypothetical protein
MSTLSTTNLKNPSASGNNIVLATDGSATIATLSSTTITGTTIQGTIKSGTAKAYNWNGVSTNTFLDFESIPSWVKRVTVIFSGVSTDGTSNLLIQIGAGSITTSGYASSSGSIAAAAAASTAGFIQSQNIAAASLYCGTSQIFLVSGNTYANSGLLSTTTASFNFISGGNITLSGTLDRVRITTVNGTDTFDAGSINLLLEG